jgi:hypothetical protein
LVGAARLRDRLESDPELWIEPGPELPDTVKWESLDGLPQESPRINSKQPVKRAPKGRKGITRNGQKFVRNGCHVLQRQYGRNRLGFATLTLDSADSNWQLLCCMHWAEIVRKFKQELQRALERVGAPIHNVGVTEIQTKRSDSVGYIVPHLHLVYVAHNGKGKLCKGFQAGTKSSPEWYLSHSDVKAIFDRVCANEISKQTGIPANEITVNNRVNLQAVRKSAEGYLGKYMSKGAKDVEKYLDQDPNRDDIPSHWWHCSKELRDIVKGLTREVPREIIEGIIGNYEYMIEEKIIRYCREIKKEIGGVERTIGYAFKLHDDYIPLSQDDIERAFNSTA